MIDKLEEYIKDAIKRGHVMENGIIRVDNDDWSYMIKKLKTPTKRN